MNAVVIAPKSGPDPVDLITLADLKTYMGIPPEDTASDELLQALITAASTFAETYCSRTFHSTDYTDEVYDGPGGRVLMLRNNPVSAVTGLTIDGQNISLAPTVNLQGYTWDSQRIVLRHMFFTMDFSNVTVSYTAGYAPDAIPADLQEAIMLLCQYNFKYKNLVGTVSRTIAGETLTTVGAAGATGAGHDIGLPDRTKNVLDYYSNILPLLPA